MMLRTAVVIGCLTLIVGCSSDPGQKKDPVEVSGTVLLPNGQPAKDVTLNLLATDSMQTPGITQLKDDGKFTLKLVPGKYTVVFEGSQSGMNTIPPRYHHNDMKNAVEVPKTGTTDLTIRLEN